MSAPRYAEKLSCIGRIIGAPLAPGQILRLMSGVIRETGLHLRAGVRETASGRILDILHWVFRVLSWGQRPDSSAAAAQRR